MKIENFILLLKHLGFSEEKGLHTKLFNNTLLQVDVNKKKIIYPEKLKIYHKRVCDFSTDENFVVFECIYQLLKKGYKPRHIELEPTWRLGHGASGGRADVLVKDQQNNNLLLIECKTAGKEFDNAWDKTKRDGGQLFSYAHQIPTIKYLCLYASDFVNRKIVRSNKIISHIPFVSFASTIKDATDRFSIWRDTFQLAYLEVGVFEPKIQPYQIGKNKYTLEDDTTPIDPHNKGQKYKQFRTILRKHSIARRETAFEVLVNLFLCKIVDEEINPKDLKFYWKGIAHDNYFDFVDRLLDLYQQGMDKFLNEEISYISDEEINKAFWVVKSNRNAAREQIQKYFRELKFFNNSAFSFLDTHNEKLFHKNAQVLLEVVQMWQKSRLKSDKQNPFLGDMFEFFLDNSIKQSNGQFFTPLPICKFIVSALPLKAKTAASKDALRVIDYACGSGHFLNEYAHQITPIVNQQGKNPANYYLHITGIEKEYRLAKVAKVAAYMHGQGQIQILDSDALANHENIMQEGYDVLVANPPFAVEGFLQTLSDEDKRQYALIKATGKSSDTNAIQCFFLERAHYLMAPEGVVGVIVPSSILSNGDSVHVRTRELLLQYFDFISIIKLGNGTFGKTGTNTVVLFLRRKPQRPECAEHYAIRVNEFFQGDTKHKKYKDEHLVQAYCQHINVPYEEYAKLLTAQSKKQIKTLLQFEMFKEYLQCWEESTEVKNFREVKKFQEKNEKDQQQDLDNLLINYLHDCEKDKLLYFILAHQQAGKVLLVSAPEVNKEQKDFLGYEWGTRKGSEGIKYKGGETVNDIITPMFDPKNLDNPNKINTAIRKNFIGELTGPLPEYCQLANLVDMLDFSRLDFSKGISVNPQKNMIIETQWESVKLEEVVETLNGLWKGKKGPFVKASVIRNTNFKKGGKLDLSDVAILDVEKKQFNTRKLMFGDIIVEKSGGSDTQAVGRVVFFDKTKGNYSYSNFTSMLRLINNQILGKYLHLFLNYFYELGYTFPLQHGMSNIRNLNFEEYLSIKIPKPPLKEQRKIIKKCETVDKEVEKAHQSIASNKQKIEQKVQNTMSASREVKKLGDIADIKNGGTPSTKKSEYWENGDIFWVTLVDTKGKYLNATKRKITSLGLDNSSAILLPINTVLFSSRATIGEVSIAKVKTATNQGYKNFICNPDILHYEYLYYALKFYAKDIEALGSGMTYKEINSASIKNFQIPVPPLKSQKKLVAELQALDAKITEAKIVLDAAPARKNAILKKHL